MESTKKLEIDFIKECLPEWSALTHHEITFERLSGITNVVYKVIALKNDITPNPIILRQFGDNGIIDRTQESYVFELLSNLGKGPKCFGSRSNIRLEEYFDSRVINPSEINKKEFRRKLARCIAGLHRIDFPKLDKTGFLNKVLEDKDFYEKFNKKCASGIFNEKETKFIKIVQSLSEKNELEFIRSLIPKEETVFCHNDLLCNNILVLSKNSDIQLIDFEYGNYNFRGFDIGNLFAESTFDYTVPTPPYYKVNEELYPLNEDLIDFIKYYLVFNNDIISCKEDEEKILEDEEIFRIYEEKLAQQIDYRSSIDKLVQEIKIGSLFSYYYWCVWGIIMSKNPDIDFDYVLFAEDKYKAYLKLKLKITNL